MDGKGMRRPLWGNRLRILGIAVLSALTSLALFACAPSDSGTASTGGGNRADSSDEPLASTQGSFAWNVDMECGACHKSEVASRTDVRCQLSQEHAGLACVECHVDIKALEAAHGQVSDGATCELSSLRATSMDDSTCLSCHTSDHTPDTTADFAGCVDRNGLVVNPHDLPETEYHATITCALCHGQHNGKLASEAAPQLCVGCHHENVYECYTCH